MLTLVAAGRFFPYNRSMVDAPAHGLAVFTLAAAAVLFMGNPEPPHLWLGFAGDLMAPLSLQNQKDLHRIYTGVEPWLRSDDLNFINMESPVEDDRPPSGYPAFNTHSSYVEAAIQAGFNVFNTANNHANDFGWPSVRGTTEAFESLSQKYPIWYSGVRQDPEQKFSDDVIKIHGWKIGFLGFSTFVNQPEGKEGVALYPYHDFWGDKNLGARLEALNRVRELAEKVDWLVVAVHGGIEYDPVTQPWEYRFFDELAQAGADVVWVQHPHVLRPWWLVKTKRGESLVLSSMGNFASDQTEDLGPSEGWRNRAETGDSCLMRIRVGLRHGRLTLEDLQPVLLSQFWDNQGERILPTKSLAQQGPVLWRGYYEDNERRQEAWANSGKRIKD